MRTATELLAQYAAYHRDRRNIVSHFVGVPMIVFAIGVLLARPALAPAASRDTGVDPLRARCRVVPDARQRGSRHRRQRRRRRAALARASRSPAAAFRSGSPGARIFVVGWLIQFVGHWYEGRKPAFVDDLVGLVVGPMFVVAEAMFMLGWNKPLLAEIERRVGPTTMRDMARPGLPLPSLPGFSARLSAVPRRPARAGQLRLESKRSKPQ